MPAADASAQRAYLVVAQPREQRRLPQNPFVALAPHSPPLRKLALGQDCGTLGKAPRLPCSPGPARPTARPRLTPVSARRLQHGPFRFFYEKPPFEVVKSVSINFSTFVDAAGVAAFFDGTVCPSPKVAKKQ